MVSLKKIHSDKLCILGEAFNSFTFVIIINIFRFIAIMVLISCFLFVFPTSSIYLSILSCPRLD